MATAKTKKADKKETPIDVFFKQNPSITIIYVDDEENIYLSYNAKENLKKVTRK
ncbi:MAG: hypothetical protein LBQ28_09195 [Prevotellaceae bacterium]|jgi:hypothetical protein|nr:hypothetical protein [Prevotellaceae bacterium]